MFSIPIGVFADNEQITSARGEVTSAHGVSTPESVGSGPMSSRPARRSRRTPGVLPIRLEETADGGPLRTGRVVRDDLLHGSARRRGWPSDQAGSSAGTSARTARLTEETIARSDAVAMSASMPTPQSRVPFTSRSTYAAARASPPALIACST